MPPWTHPAIDACRLQGAARTAHHRPVIKVFILLRSAGACAGLSAREFWRPDLVSAAARRAAMQPRDFVAFKCRILSRPRVIGAENALTRRAPMTAAAATAVS